jgi:hypothetical protein
MWAAIWAFMLGIIQNIAANWLAYVLGGSITAGLAYWTKTIENLSWPITVILGLVVSTCLTVLYSYGAEWGRNYFAATKTVEEQVKEWLDEPGYRVTRVRPQENELFRFMTELPMGGVKIHVSQPKRESVTIELITFIPRDPGMQQFFSRLNHSQAERVMSKMYLELLRAGVQYTTSSEPNILITLQDQIDFDGTLTRNAFIRRLFNMQTALRTAMVAYTLEETSSLEAVTKQ